MRLCVCRYHAWLDIIGCLINIIIFPNTFDNFFVLLPNHRFPYPARADSLHPRARDTASMWRLQRTFYLRNSPSGNSCQPPTPIPELDSQWHHHQRGSRSIRLYRYFPEWSQLHQIDSENYCCLAGACWGLSLCRDRWARHFRVQDIPLYTNCDTEPCGKLSNLR